MDGWLEEEPVFGRRPRRPDRWLGLLPSRSVFFVAVDSRDLFWRRKIYTCYLCTIVITIIAFAVAAYIITTRTAATILLFYR